MNSQHIAVKHIAKSIQAQQNQNLPKLAYPNAQEIQSFDRIKESQ